MKELREILARASLNEQDRAKLEAAIETLEWLQGEIRSKEVSLAQLRKELFGAPKTEKTRQVLGEDSPKKTESAEEEESGEDRPSGSASQERERPPGHGRNGADQYVGGRRVVVPHESLRPGDPCPESGCRGKLYRLPKPRVIVCVVGQAPVQATVYEQEVLRCALCQKVFVAALPEGVRDRKYDETTAAMIGLLKYGSGMPFNRLERLEGNLGIPLPAATQWEIVRDAARDLVPAHEELRRQAAQGKVLYNDDTSMRILEHLKENRQKKEGERTGTFTTGIVSEAGDHRIALFMTGRPHAGENLTTVLSEREGQLPAPIQMCDGLDRNLPDEEFETILANCLGHGRRHFVKVVESFPEECRTVLEALREVYRHEAATKRQNLTPEDRLRYHQQHSGPVMETLKTWMKEQFEQKKVEPNSPLGAAIAYMQKRWDRLTLFLRQVGAPLDNNACERILKKAILHRKNALFFKTQNGAHVGDVFMSLIHTAELNAVNPFHYLAGLLRHAREVRANAETWMPWNYWGAPRF